MSANTPSLRDLRIDDTARHGGPGKPMARALVFFFAMVVLGAAAWYWFGRTAAVPVTTAVVEAAAAAGASDQPAVLNASGYVTARRRATVSSKMTGKVVEVRVEEGMAVTRGQVLARLDDTTWQRYLELAEAELAAARGTAEETEVRLREAKLSLARAQAMVKEGIQGQAELDRAQADHDALVARLALVRQQVAVADRQVALRRTELEDTVIRAPFSGVAISKDAQPGEMVSPVSAGGGFTRTGICTIVDMSSLEIEVDVNEAYINRVTDDQRVEATLDAYPEWKIPARVITTVPTADRQRATVLVRIAFDGLDPRILPDMGVKVAFLGAPAPVSSEASAPRLLVPRAAVRSDGGQDIVFVVVDGRAERRAVRLGGARNDQVDVVSGLTAGEQVVVEAPPDLADGARVTVK